MRSCSLPLLIYAHFVLLLGYHCGCAMKLYAGPYVLSLDKVVRCKTKSSKPDVAASNFTVTKLSNGEEQFIGFFDVSQNTKMTKGVIKSTAFTDIRAANFEQAINRPCKGIVFSLILNQYLNADKDCVVKKGIYKVDVKPNKLIHTYFNNIPHGNYKFTLEYYAKKSEVMCIDFFAKVEPITKSKSK